jgi:hypothetical protein
MSDLFKLSKEDGKKILNGFIIALIGAGLTYLEGLKVDFGQWTVLVVALNSVVVNAVRKWLSDKEGKILGRFKM